MRAGNIAAVEVLLKYGADIQAKDNDGKTAVDLAEACGNGDIANYIANLTNG
ncbi:ankyrin repeat domain-containing protein [Solibacillus sp. FSL K6-1523]|uniref:ankyrin repeat domain-containing protein n=1 Tax=Solibacillus sp. FSL K6-1523 TaxID=2921471 RepID=UPI0030F6F54D